MNDKQRDILLLIILLFCIVMTLHGQDRPYARSNAIFIKIDSTGSPGGVVAREPPRDIVFVPPVPVRGNYKAYQLDTYLYKERQSTVETDIIFEFGDDRITTTNHDNTQTLYIEGDFMDDVLVDLPVKKVQVVDRGGFAAVLVMGWYPAEERYFIIISYNNVDLFYMVERTQERIQQGYSPLPGHRMFTGDYSEEEIADFVKFLVNWGVIFEF